MARLTCLSSGSIGNSYFIETENEILLLELGISWDEILKGINFKEGFRKVVGCLVTHVHSDHFRPNTAKKALSRGLRICSSQDVHDNGNSGTIVLQPNNKYRIGRFIVQPIEVEHNVQNYAYLIEHEEIGRLLFATDLVSFPYNVKNLNHIMMEANYSNDIIVDKLCDGFESRSRSEYHHELEDCLESLRMLNNPNLSNVMLIHLSDFGSDEELFKKRVFEEIGIMPTIANKGVEIELNKEDF